MRESEAFERCGLTGLVNEGEKDNLEITGTIAAKALNGWDYRYLPGRRPSSHNLRVARHPLRTSKPAGTVTVGTAIL